jgi:ketosteroid isomerase-like protein
MADRDAVRRIAESWVDAYNRKDYAQLRTILADDFVLTDHGLGLTLTGGEKFVDGIRAVAETDIPDRRLTALRVMAEGDTAIIEGSWRGTVQVERWGLQPGSIRRHKSCTLLDIRDGKIIRMTDYTCDEH